LKAKRREKLFLAKYSIERSYRSKYSIQRTYAIKSSPRWHSQGDGINQVVITPAPSGNWQLTTGDCLSTVSTPTAGGRNTAPHIASVLISSPVSVIAVTALVATLNRQ